MITLVSSPKQQLRKHMQHSVFIIFQLLKIKLLLVKAKVFLSFVY